MVVVSMSRGIMEEHQDLSIMSTPHLLCIRISSIILYIRSSKGKILCHKNWFAYVLGISYLRNQWLGQGILGSLGLCNLHGGGILHGVFIG